MKIRHIISRALVGVSFAISITACSNQQYSLPGDSNDFASNVPMNNKVDIILMVDNSSSMDLYQGKLAAQAESVVSTLDLYGMDYHIAVVNSNSVSNGGGVFMGAGAKYLTKSSTGLVNELKNRINQGNSGSDVERGIESVMSVLDSNYLRNDGVGFFRDEALLAVIALTNEDDKSSNSISSVTSFLDQLKKPLASGARSWVVNMIGVPSITSSCSSSLDGIYKEAGLRWIELANASGGLVQSICDSTFASGISNIQARIVQFVTQYVLNREPKEETIRVYVNGVEIPKDANNGWQYIATGNLIRFYGSAIPKASAQVAVKFDPKTAM